MFYYLCNLCKISVVIFLASLPVAACGGLNKPVLSSVAYANSLSNHRIIMKSYEVPEGIFRGALWPNESSPNFQIWIIDDKKELFFDIPAPDGFHMYEKEVTDNWNFEVSKTTKERITYLAYRKDNSRLIQVELPLKERKYSFSVLRNSEGEEMLIFMDISENIIDRGLFGYVVIGMEKNET